MLINEVYYSVWQLVGSNSAFPTSKCFYNQGQEFIFALFLFLHNIVL